MLDGLGTVDQMLAEPFPGLRIDGVSDLGEIEGEKEERRQLRDKGLGRSHANLRSRMGVDGAVGLPGHGGADHIADGQHL